MTRDMKNGEVEINKFNVRVYAIFINDHEEVLVSDEIIRTKYYSKFPGGGLEFNESPIECLHREAQEEMGCEIEVLEHFYTTDQFIRSYFRPWEQVLCVYHRAKIADLSKLKVSNTKFDFDASIDGDQESFRWVKIHDLRASDFRFLSDSTVVDLLRKEYGYI